MYDIFLLIMVVWLLLFGGGVKIYALKLLENVSLSYDIISDVALLENIDFGDLGG